MARVLWNIPVLLMPPVVMGAMDKTKAFRGKPVVRLGFLTGLSTVAVILGLYPAQAVYPQQVRPPFPFPVNPPPHPLPPPSPSF